MATAPATTGAPTRAPSIGRRGLLGWLAAAPAAALATKAITHQATMFAQLSREEIHRRGFGQGIERDSNLIETRLALHEYRIRHGKDHWRRYADARGLA